MSGVPLCAQRQWLGHLFAEYNRNMDTETLAVVVVECGV